MIDGTDKLLDFGVLGVFCFIFVITIGVMLRIFYLSLSKDIIYLKTKNDALEEYIRTTLSRAVEENSKAFNDLREAFNDLRICIERSHCESAAALDRLTEALKTK